MQLLRTNALILLNVVMAGVIVGIGTFGKRYRYHPFTRFIFLGATTLFLPIISSVISTVSSSSNDYAEILGDQGPDDARVVICSENLSHLILVITWAFLTHITMINTSTVVAGDDREGRNAGVPLVLLVQGGWTFYLAVSSKLENQKDGPIVNDLAESFRAIQYAPFALICAKIIFKYYALEKARRSIAFGRNPRLIFGYMQQLQVQEASQPSDPSPPPLLVMGEQASHVKKQPHGYAFQNDLGSATASAISNIDGLMTIDRIWEYDEDMMLGTSGVQVKDICLSFSLFKLLRCRFARYNVSKVGTMGTLSFLWSLFLKDGEHVRIFQLVADELSFLDDYYYSSLPISFSKWWLPILSVSISLSTISYCIVTVSVIQQWATQGEGLIDGQMFCYYWCSDTHRTTDGGQQLGLPIIDAVAPCLLIALIMISEVKDLASYQCSNWTKVALFCHFVNNTTWQHSFQTRKWVGIILRCRWKLMMKHWDEKIGQCSVLVLHQRRPTQFFVPLMRLLRFPERKKNVKIPEAVKICIIRALRSVRNGGLSQGTSSLRQTQAGERLLWACNGKGTSDTILVWHIATCIFEHQQAACHKHGSPSNLDSEHKIAATHLSRYCAYLMVSLPELLPDDDAWSKDLYKAVKKDADRVLASRAAMESSSTPEDKCQQLVELLGEGSKNEELKNGVKLGKQLVELAQGEEEAWKLLAGFWSEMILYVAPSDNLKGHSEAIARGGELITLLWALLFHVGIFSRPNETDGAAASTAAGDGV
ncbi:hypothetical protein HU200_003571 [Digitaria exilis]|uniref:DUF4220 domain-containing protein n=1 Tax=Digitaria exilis TaxID=1010633 RepID=A0A835FTP6_9POAL|nr:hypothetical protein HU200_003571 [Digitaria exilis]